MRKFSFLLLFGLIGWAAVLPNSPAEAAEGEEFSITVTPAKNVEVKGDEKKDLIEKVLGKLKIPRNDNIFYLRYAFLLGVDIEQIYEATKIDRWFLYQIREITDLEKELYSYSL